MSNQESFKQQLINAGVDSKRAERISKVLDQEDQTGEVNRTEAQKRDITKALAQLNQ